MAALLSLVMIVGFFSPVLPVRAEEETGLTAMGKSAETALPGGETKTSDNENGSGHGLKSEVTTDTSISTDSDSEVTGGTTGSHTGLPKEVNGLTSADDGESEETPASGEDSALMVKQADTLKASFHEGNALIASQADSFTATFVDGETETRLSAGEDGTVTAPEPQNVPDGRKFRGWKHDDELVAAGDKITLTEDVTYTAAYAIAVTFKAPMIWCSTPALPETRPGS